LPSNDALLTRFNEHQQFSASLPTPTWLVSITVKETGEVLWIWFKILISLDSTQNTHSLVYLIIFMCELVNCIFILNEQKHYDHLHNVLLVCRMLPKTVPTKAWTPQDSWRFPVVSDTMMLAADPSSPVGCEVELLWITLVGQAHPKDAQLDWDPTTWSLKPFLNVCSVL